MKTWVVLALLAAAAAWGWKRWGPYSITNPTPPNGTIVAFGDSLTYGSGASEEGSYPAQLSRRIGRPILNRGVPGDTTALALQRLDKDVLSENPGVVLICLGGNDLLRQVDSAQTFRNLETLIGRIQGKGALVILIGLGGTPLSPTLGSRYRDLARRTGCPFVPDILGGILGDPQLMADGVHPNSKGYGRFALEIEPVLREYLIPAPSGKG